MECWESCPVKSIPRTFCSAMPVCNNALCQVVVRVFRRHQFFADAQRARISESTTLLWAWREQPVQCGLVADLMRMVGMHPPDSEIDVTV